LKQYITRLCILMIGLIFFAIGIVLTIRANIGTPPWEVFHVGLAVTFGLSIGTVSILVGLLIAIFVIAYGEKLGLGTVLNIFVIGVLVDIFLFITPISENVIIGTLMLVVGIICISFGSCLYIKSAFGVGPRDSLMVVLTRKTKLPVGLCRFGIELLVTAGGWFLGGMVGLGTVLFVFLIGVSIQLTFKIMRFNVTTVQHETLRQTYRAIRNLAKKHPA